IAVRRLSIKRLAVFASGNGSNLRNIHEKMVDGIIISAELALVVSNNSDSGALEYAKTRNIPSVHVSLLNCGGTEVEYCNRLLSLLNEHAIDFIALAGYMKKLPDAVVDGYSNKILNVHPALLPSFGGTTMYG